MTRTKIQTPYYSIQYLLREFAKGLGTKSLAGKKIDDACKVSEINPYHLDKLKKELIHEPLTKYVNINFADHILEKFEQITRIYFQLIRTVPLDGVSADVTRPLLDRFFMTFSVAFMCSESLDGMKLTPKDIAHSSEPLVKLVLKKLDSSNNWKNFITSCSDAQKERLRAWSQDSNTELPELSSIAALGEKWQIGNDWGTYKARLVTARLWDYFFNRSGHTDATILKHNSLQQCLETLAKEFLNLLEQSKDKYSVTTPLALELWKQLRLREERKKGSQQQCFDLLGKLKNQQELIDVNKETTYFYHWMKARYQLHSGYLQEAIAEYEHAFEQVIYRQGENTEKIIIEAIIACCRSPKPNKSFINRLRRMAVVMNIDIMPSDHSRDGFKAKPQEIESWEIVSFSHYFNSFFTKESFFEGASYPESNNIKAGFCIVEELSHQVDLSKPNSVFSVGSDGGLIKKMPQLVYFSMTDNLKAISDLLDKGADVNILSSSHESAILLAVMSMQANIYPINSMSDDSFKLISQKEHKKSILDTLTDKKKLSPLGCAVQTGRLDIVSKLIEMGVTVDRRHDIHGETPLFTAIGLIANHTRPTTNDLHWKAMKYSEMNLQSVRAHAAGLVPHDLNHLREVMMKQESNPNFQITQEIIHATTRENIKKYTTADGFRKIAKLLIQHGADPNAKHDTAMLGYTPLMLAIELDEAELVEAMLHSKYHKVNLEDSCINSISKQRLSIAHLIKNWKSFKVAKVLANNTTS